MIVKHDCARATLNCYIRWSLLGSDIGDVCEPGLQQCSAAFATITSLRESACDQTSHMQQAVAGHLQMLQPDLQVGHVTITVAFGFQTVSGHTLIGLLP